MNIFFGNYTDDPNSIAIKIYAKDFKNNGWEIFNPSEIDNLKKFFKDKNIDNIKNIYFFYCYGLIEKNWDYISGLDCNKCLFLDDIHQSGSNIIELRKRIFSNFTHLFSTYAYCFNKYYGDEFNNKLYWLPHCAVLKTPFNYKPIRKILLSGNATKESYPTRYYLYNLQKFLPIDILEHPTYNYDLHDILGRKYYEYLNQYLVCYTCCSTEKTPYIIRKFFEICASGSLLFAYDKYVKKELEELGFKDGINYIGCDEEDLDKKLEWVLSYKNFDKVNKIRMEGYKLVTGRHMGKNRVEYINKILNI